MAGITQAQKQALLDNMQLEITERARKLRAQYALQAQGLRARLEMRVNRIPTALRKRNIQELIDEYAERAKPAPPPPMRAASKAQPTKTSRTITAQPEQARKRKSAEISAGHDKENVPSADAEELANPKKRQKATVVANSKAPRTASRKAGPGGVLSPKSHNSRTLPQSPLKPSTLSPEKARPTKVVPSTQTAAASRSTRAPSRQQAKRTGAASDAEGRTSGASNSSAGTTIVTKSGTRKPPLPRKTASAKSATGGRKATATTKHEAAPVAATGRTLRKRNN